MDFHDYPYNDPRENTNVTAEVFRKAVDKRLNSVYANVNKVVITKVEVSKARANSIRLTKE